MRDIYKDEELSIPEGVSVEVKARVITVKGPRGELRKVCIPREECCALPAPF